MGEIDFSGNTDGSVVLRTRQGVAVYTNANGDVVIRQEGWLGEDDALIIVPRCDAEMLAEAIRNEARNA